MNYIDMSIVCNLIGKIVGIVLVGLASYITPKAVAWLEQKKLYTTVQSLVECAEQTLAGSKLKKDYVLAVLKDLGYENNPHLNAVVEGLVYELKQAKPQILPEDLQKNCKNEEYNTEICEDCIVRLD